MPLSSDFFSVIYIKYLLIKHKMIGNHFLREIPHGLILKLFNIDKTLSKKYILIMNNKGINKNCIIIIIQTILVKKYDKIEL